MKYIPSWRILIERLEGKEFMDSWWEDMKACQFTDDQAEKFIMNRLMECFSDPMRDKINESFPVELERLFPKKK